MNDPHVEWLRFTISSGEHISYDRPSPKQFTNNVGRFEAADGELVVTLADHFATIEEARRAVERLLRAWEIDADLDGGLGTIRFTYKDAHVVDRNPLPTTTGTVVLSGVATAGGVATVHAVGHSIRRTYPEPPDWLATDDLELAYLRWRQFKQGGETLPGMAYVVLTRIETFGGERKTGRRDDAARALAIHPDVLSMVGRLADIGDERTARKVPKTGTHQPLTANQQRWLEEAIKQLIKRVGAHGSGHSLNQLTMCDLPDLD